MRQPTQVIGWLLISLLAGCSGTEPVTDPNAGEVGTRAVPQVQRSTKSGVAAKPGAGGQANAQIPTFPQKFDVKGPEVDSFGFAVTQPGPITVDVQGQGAPLLVTLQSSGGQPITQPATGGLRMSYNVTPQDVQRSVFWVVQFRLAQSMPPLQGGRATGTVNVQYPPVDQAAAQQAVQTQLRPPTQQELDQARAQGEAQVTAVISARKAQFAQDQERRFQADRARVQPLLDRMSGGTPGQVRSRGLDEKEPSAIEPAQSSEELTSRAIPDKQVLQSSKQQTIPQQNSGKMSGILPPSPPQITSLSDTSGGPKKTIIINGTGFSTAQGQVYFTAPPDRTFSATITNWTDTGIGIEIPNVTGVMPYQANLYVQRGQDRSNTVLFSYVPRPELRTIRSMTDDRRHSGTVLTNYLAGPGNKMMHVRIPGIPFSEFAGEKGNDEYFLRTQLKNGWTVAGATMLKNPVNVTVSAAQAGTYQWLGDGYIQEQGTGSNPYLNVRWWVNAFTPFTIYYFLIDIVGPEGIPDGVVIP